MDTALWVIVLCVGIGLAVTGVTLVALTFRHPAGRHRLPEWRPSDETDERLGFGDDPPD
jgi:hypothetical protein